MPPSAASSLQQPNGYCKLKIQKQHQLNKISAKQTNRFKHNQVLLHSPLVTTTFAWKQNYLKKKMQESLIFTSWAKSQTLPVAFNIKHIHVKQGKRAERHLLQGVLWSPEPKTCIVAPGRSSQARSIPPKLMEANFCSFNFRPVGGRTLWNTLGFC